jgi:hypothetical protein
MFDTTRPRRPLYKTLKESVMPFTGKATYTAGATLPEIAEDVADLVAINFPHETPLLDALGDPARPARSTIHEWLEDSLLPNSDSIAATSGDDIEVAHIDRFRVGDLIRIGSSAEVMLVTAVSTVDSEITVTRGYGGTPTVAIVETDPIHIIGNAALEGDDAQAARFVSRARVVNYTQILSATLEVSGSELAVRQIGVRDELDYQKNQRTRELLRDLESSVINGVAPEADPQGGATVRRSMRGILSFLQTNRFVPDENGFPDDTTLTEEQLNLALRSIWNGSSGSIDLIVCGGAQKRAINGFVASNRRFAAGAESFKSLVNVYESDFGVCRVVLSRAVPSDTVLLLDSTRIEVMPLSGRSFHYKPLASTGDRESGLVVGEYTLEFRNESAHGVITGLAA